MPGSPTSPELGYLRFVLLAAYPELEQEHLCSERPLLLGGSGWIADAIITQSSGLSLNQATRLPGTLQPARAEKIVREARSPRTSDCGLLPFSLQRSSSP